jgi:F0F1-type ATP synthase delta subunit
VGKDDRTVREIIRRFVHYLQKRRELYLLPAVYRTFERLEKRAVGTVVTSRYPLDHTTRTDVIRFIKASYGKVDEDRIRFLTDDSVIGGVRVRHEDMLYDATLQTLVERMRAHIVV